MRKVSSPAGLSAVTSTASTSACAGPWPHQSTIASTADGGPSNQASTVPSARLRTHPPTPAARAARAQLSRKNTPWTTPRTTARRAMGGACSGVGAVPRGVELGDEGPAAVGLVVLADVGGHPGQPGEGA